MARQLDLNDIQGNVIRAYGKYGYPKARYFFLRMTAAPAGRRFVDAALPKITTAKRWPVAQDGSRIGPPCTMNIGFTFMGLYWIGLPTRTLKAMPDEFIDGMRKRGFVLGDRPLDASDAPVAGEVHPAWMARYDRIWRENRSGDQALDVHIWVSMNAKVQFGTETPVQATDDNGDPTPENVLDAQTRWLDETCADISRDPNIPGEIEIIAKNGDSGLEKYQAASAIFRNFGTETEPVLLPTPYEHFGLTDGIGDPVFEGQFAPEDEALRIKGRGKWMDPDKGWEPLATGEFLLGYPDESQETPPAPRPPEFAKNGTFMAYRKLHENVSSFHEYFAEEGKKFAKVTGVPLDWAEVTLRSKLVGRWPDGVPLSSAPTWGAWQQVRDENGMNDPDPKRQYAAEIAYLRTEHASDFKFATDISGYDCPTQSHLRRVNTRDYLDPQNDLDPKTAPLNNKNARSSLNKRRRILRRGLPYGPSSLGGGDDQTERGVVMMIICANLFRQFEFVQQQWIQYGLDFNAGNNTCPLIGDHTKTSIGTRETPYVCDGLRNFVEPRGGEYFFIPSMTALRMLADGVVDPT